MNYDRKKIEQAIKDASWRGDPGSYEQTEEMILAALDAAFGSDTSVPVLLNGAKYVATIPAGARICAFGNRLVVAHPDMPAQEITLDGLKPL